MKPLVLLTLLGCLAAVFAAPQPSVKWCVKSEAEQTKCTYLSKASPVFSCVRRDDSQSCITAITAGEADAITLDGGDIYTAGLKNYNLQPIIAEDYGTGSETCYYAVAVVKKTSTFKFSELKGKRSCHTGLGKSAGWNIPIGTLLYMNLTQWEGPDEKPLEEAVSEFFSASCAPGAVQGSKLCQQCKNDCSRSHKEPYYDYAGAFTCLTEDAGDVAFVKHLTVPESEYANYELLCKDDTRRPISDYQNCHLAKVPAHAVVTRKEPDLAKLIWDSLNSTNFNLFSSATYSAKNLIFKDSTVKLVQVPPNTDSFLYLGAEYMSIIRSLKKEQTSTTTSDPIRWCAVGQAETTKCDLWSINAVDVEQPDKAAIECVRAETTDECLKKIMRKEADAIAVDGGQVYTAGKCGLVPVLAEQYDESQCHNGRDASSSYYAVAVVKKNSGVTWDTLKGKKSCHTGVGRTAGWNIPMGLIHRQTNNCNFSEFFSDSCAPGSEPGSSFCRLCAGSGKSVGDEDKCKASAEEKYYGYAGAFRCLVEGNGDVAFIKHTTVPENSDGQGPEWARGLNSHNYELICPGDVSQAEIAQYKTCHLALVPAHAVVTRPESRTTVVPALKDHAARFGPKSTPFKLFQSDGGKNLLFKDSTKCFQEVPAGTSYSQFLQPEYIEAITSLRQCDGSTPDLEKSCTFHSCQQKN